MERIEYCRILDKYNSLHKLHENHKGRNLQFSPVGGSHAEELSNITTLAVVDSGLTTTLSFLDKIPTVNVSFFSHFESAKVVSDTVAILPANEYRKSSLMV